MCSIHLIIASKIHRLALRFSLVLGCSLAFALFAVGTTVITTATAIAATVTAAITIIIIVIIMMFIIRKATTTLTITWI